MRITELFTAQSIALDEALQTQEEILSRLVELQATHGNITDKDAYKKALYAREAEGSTYVDNGITVPHAKTAVVTRPSLAALRLSTPVQYNAEDDGTTDLLFAIAAPENGSLHVDMLAHMMQMLMNEDFVEKLKAAKTPAEFLDCIDAQEEAQFGAESFTQQEIPQSGYRILAVTACVNGIAHTYMAAEALTKAGDKLGLPTKVETNGSDGAKNILTREEIANCDGIIVAAEKKVETARFDGKPVLFTRVDDGIHKPEELIKKIVLLQIKAGQHLLHAVHQRILSVQQAGAELCIVPQHRLTGKQRGRLRERFQTELRLGAFKAAAAHPPGHPLAQLAAEQHHHNAPQHHQCQQHRPCRGPLDQQHQHQQAAQHGQTGGEHLQCPSWFLFHQISCLPPHCLRQRARIRPPSGWEGSSGCAWCADRYSCSVPRARGS